FVLTAVQPGRVPTQRSGGSNLAQNALTEVRRGEGNMIKRMQVQLVILLLAAVAAAMSASRALAASRPEIQRDAGRALQRLYATSAAAKLLGEKAKAVLVFPSVVKAGFLFGGQMGDGVLMKHGKTAGYYNTVAASYGLQAGVQVFGYALFFMN